MIEGVGCDISIRTNAAWQTGGGQNIEFVGLNSSRWDCKEFRALESGLARHEHPAWALLTQSCRSEPDDRVEGGTRHHGERTVIRFGTSASRCLVGGT